jgi:hypothetical protein
MSKFLADSAKMQKCVQYALLANADGFYSVCASPRVVHLKKNEVWKYGVTCEENPNSRYSESYFLENKVIFVPEFYGNKLECEIEEKRKLIFYPLLPENIAREKEDRLILPPGNCQTR